MKKPVTLTLTLLMGLSILSQPAMADEPLTLKCGMLSMLNLNEDEVVNLLKARNQIGDQLDREGFADKELGQETGSEEDGNGGNMPEPNREVIFFDSLDAMLMDLNAGGIDYMEVPQTTASYLINNNPELVQTVTYSDKEDKNTFAKLTIDGLMSNDFAFMFMEDNSDLRDEFDAALASISEEEMEQLTRDYITAVTAGDEVAPVEMPVFEGADTVKVAVTGSLPPMDYVDADGTPAGFNTALLAEISKRTGKNIELVLVDSVGRAAALASGTVDAVFWTRTNSASNLVASQSEEEKDKRREEMQADMSDEEIETMNRLKDLISFSDYGRSDMPEGTIITTAYFSDVIVPVFTQVHRNELRARANN